MQTEPCPQRAVASSHRRERSERWQVVGVGPHDKLRNADRALVRDVSPLDELREDRLPQQLGRQQALREDEVVEVARAEPVSHRALDLGP
jgi:hypothetical protein